MIKKHILVVGLGNPGNEYINTRHNIGFILIDLLSEFYLFPNFLSKFSGLVSTKIIDDYKVILFKPQNFMNLSGDAVMKIKNYYKIPLEDIFIIHDDLDLVFAKTKVKFSGGSGGHNGIKSIDQMLGNDYYRLKIGIDRPNNKIIDVSNFVLSKFLNEELRIIDLLGLDICKNFLLLIEKKISVLQNILSLEYQKYGI